MILNLKKLLVCLVVAHAIDNAVGVPVASKTYVISLKSPDGTKTGPKVTSLEGGVKGITQVWLGKTLDPGGTYTMKGVSTTDPNNFSQMTVVGRLVGDIEADLQYISPGLFSAPINTGCRLGISFDVSPQKEGKQEEDDYKEDDYAGIYLPEYPKGVYDNRDFKNDDSVQAYHLEGIRTEFPGGYSIANKQVPCDLGKYNLKLEVVRRDKSTTITENGTAIHYYSNANKQCETAGACDFVQDVYLYYGDKAVPATSLPVSALPDGFLDSIAAEAPGPSSDGDTSGGSSGEKETTSGATKVTATMMLGVVFTSLIYVATV